MTRGRIAITGAQGKGARSEGMWMGKAEKNIKVSRLGEGCGGFLS